MEIHAKYIYRVYFYIYIFLYYNWIISIIDSIFAITHCRFAMQFDVYVIRRLSFLFHHREGYKNFFSYRLCAVICVRGFTFLLKTFVLDRNTVRCACNLHRICSKLETGTARHENFRVHNFGVTASMVHNVRERNARHHVTRSWTQLPSALGVF